ERAKIAGVFVRRLEHHMLLQTDPSVIYGMGARYDGNIRKSDLAADTPYNTYTRPGLPPTPIALPGRPAIAAALHPAAGKSTLLAGVLACLRQRGLSVVQAREPGGTPVGEAVRAIVLDPALAPLAAETELLLMFASRAQLVREVIGPALAAGQWVVCDRFADASYAYQGGGRGQPAARIEELERWACDGVKPDLTLLLDLPVAAGRARAAGRGEADRIESEADA